KKRQGKEPETSTADAPTESSHQTTTEASAPESPPAVAEHPHEQPTAEIPAPAARRRAKRERSGPSMPSVPGRIAAGLTGLLVGAAGGAATYGAMAGCEAVRGVSTCGGAPGFFILVAILVLMVLLGAAILKTFGVSDPGSTSFLAVGIVAVVVMLTLLDVIFSPWMFAVVPLLSAASYLLAHWVTTRFDDETAARQDWS
ncbi:MAG TPA: hypothetical protein VLB03_08695, partial [Nocardioidaceae bacterium]|nr:hypothetical protein [Nocardioidaceae bacterium]